MPGRALKVSDGSETIAADRLHRLEAEGRRRCAERTPGFCAAPLLAPSLTPLWSARHLGEERHARARAARFDVLAHEWRHLEPLDARERAQNRQHEAVVD